MGNSSSKQQSGTKPTDETPKKHENSNEPVLLNAEGGDNVTVLNVRHSPTKEPIISADGTRLQTTTLVLDEGVIDTLKEVLSWEVHENAVSSTEQETIDVPTVSVDTVSESHDNSTPLVTSPAPTLPNTASHVSPSPTVICVSPKKQTSNTLVKNFPTPSRNRRIHPQRNSVAEPNHFDSLDGGTQRLTQSSVDVEKVVEKHSKIRAVSVADSSNIEEEIEDEVITHSPPQDTESIDDETTRIRVLPKISQQRPTASRSSRPPRPSTLPHQQSPLNGRRSLPKLEEYSPEIPNESISPHPPARVPSFARPTIAYTLRKRKPVQTYRPMHMKRHSVPTPYVGRPFAKKSPFPKVSSPYSSTPPPRRASEHYSKFQPSLYLPQIANWIPSPKLSSFKATEFSNLGEISIGDTPSEVSSQRESVEVSKTPSSPLVASAENRIESPLSPSVASFSQDSEEQQQLRLSVLELMKQAEQLEEGEEFLSALQTYKKALQITRQLKEKSTLAPNISQRISDVLDAQSLAYAAQGNFQKAVDFGRRSIQIQSSLGFSHGQLCSLFQLSNLYTKEGLYTDAINCLVEMTKIQRDNGRLDEEVSTTRQIGQLYRMMKNYPATMHYMQQCAKLQKQLSKKLGMPVRTSPARKRRIRPQWSMYLQ